MPDSLATEHTPEDMFIKIVRVPRGRRVCFSEGCTTCLSQE